MAARCCSECGVEINRKPNAKTCGESCATARHVRRKCERDAANCQPREAKPRPLPPLVRANNESDKGFSQAELLARKARTAERFKAAKSLNTTPCASPDDGPAMLPKDADPDWNGFPPGPRRRRLIELFREVGFG